MSLRRVAIIGMNNPHGPEPRLALWPEPHGSTGANLWRLTAARTGCTRMDYACAFHRYNLVERGMWDDAVARHRWSEIERDVLEGFDTLVLLGVAVRRALGLQLPELHISRSLICLPHPSGLNRWYNVSVNRRMVEVVMEELYVEATGALPHEQS
jgi:hypothetical protein